MQFRSSKTRLLIAILNIVTQLCDENIETLLHPIYLKWKSQQLVSELLDSTYIGSPKYAGVYLEISLLDCLTTKKFQDFPKISEKFEDFPGLFKFQDFPGLLGTIALTENHRITKTRMLRKDGLLPPLPRQMLSPKCSLLRPLRAKIVISPKAAVFEKFVPQ